MGHSYDKAPPQPRGRGLMPIQWTDQVPHKYCGKLDQGRKGKPNKVHLCEQCLVIKGQQAKWRDGPQDTKAKRRKEKMGWHLGPGGGGDQ